jgi:hypothetical protein
VSTRRILSDVSPLTGRLLEFAESAPGSRAAGAGAETQLPRQTGND